jgi:hypothetical protein
VVTDESIIRETPSPGVPSPGMKGKSGIYTTKNLTKDVYRPKAKKKQEGSQKRVVLRNTA